MPVPNKWVYLILLLFVVFLIWQDPGTAGTTTRNFAGWLGNIISSLFEFLGNLLGPEGADGGTQQGPAEQTPTPGTSGSTSGIDEFDDNPTRNN